MTADGFHSLLDSSSNIIGLVGLYLAARPADANHHYGHHKYETLAAVGIAALLGFTAFEILERSIEKLRWGLPPLATTFSFGVMAVTMAINATVSTYEHRRGKRLQSEVLIADAAYTRSDIYVSLSVIVSLIAARLGFPLLDVLVAFVITGVIARSAYLIVRSSSTVLSDAAVLDPKEIEQIVRQVPGVLSCHKIRTRGRPPVVYMDLHIQLPSHLTLGEAHSISHDVKSKLESKFGTRDIVIHIEPKGGEEDYAS